MDAMRESPRDIPADEWEILERVADGGEHLKRGSEFMRLRDLMIFRLMGNAGLRIHEAVELRVDDLHLEHGYIHVLGKGQKHRKVKVKGGKLVDAIRAWQAVMPKSLDGTLITDEHGHSIGRIAAWTRFTMIAETAHVQATPHALRHTFIYRLIDTCMKRGMHWAAALKTVCQQTGDTAEVILEYYSGARESDICAAMEAM
jgi:site-specific recombinase XerC